MPATPPIRRPILPPRLAGVLIAAVVFCAVVPTLPWLEFGDPIENLNVATAMEIRRTGHWLFPTLQGEPRLAKPPLTAWLTALSIRRSTLAQLNAPTGIGRVAAYRRLAFECRLPALVAMCAMIVVVYEMGRTLPLHEGIRNQTRASPDGHALGWMAALACGSTFLFLTQCRLATTDAQFALWVAVTNLCLAKAVFERRPWLGFLCGGTALGLALMTKGPVALVQSALPFAIYLLWGRRTREPVLPSRWLLPFVSGLLLMCIVGLTWYFRAACEFAGAKSLWLAEAIRVGADGPASGKPWYQYAVSLYVFLPWLPWLAAGAWLALKGRHDPGAPPEPPGPGCLTLLLFLFPLVVMSFSRDRFMRYLTPLAPAGALLAAVAIARYPRRAVAVGATVAIAAATFAGQAVYVAWWSARPASRSTLRPVAEQIRSAYPDAELYAYRPGGRNVISVPADDLSIHLDRTVGWATDPARIAPSRRPQVFVIYRTRRPNDADLVPPKGWLLLAKPRSAGNEDRSVFVRPGEE